jgi:putative phosphoesterase
VAEKLIVGVISDTHGLLREQARAALAGCDVVLHAGDIGGPDVIEALQQIAPVFAVRGNVDGGWARLLPERRRLDLAGASVLLLHDRALVGASPFAADEAPAAAARSSSASPGQRVIVFGHSHQPLAETRGGVLWFNPGSAGPRRFALPVSVGRLSIEGGRVRGRLLRLDV